MVILNGKKLHSVVLSHESVDRLKENVKACIVLAILSFVPFSYLTQRGFSDELAKIMAGTFLVVGFVIYFLVFDTRIHFFRRFLTYVVSRLANFFVFLYLAIAIIIILLAILFILHRDFLLVLKPVYIIMLFFSCLLGMHLGLLFTSNNLARLWDQGLLYTMIMFLICDFFVISVLYLYNEQIQGALLRCALLTTLLSFSSMHVFIKRLLVKIRILEKNMLDMQELTPKEKATWIYNWIRGGRIWTSLAVLFLNRCVRNKLLKLSPKEICKVRCRILFRRGEHDKVIEIAQTCSAEEKSSVLISLEALSYLQKGKITQAFDILSRAREADSSRVLSMQNPHFPLNIGYICWHEGRIDQAIEFGRAALQIDPTCPLALNNQAFFVAEKARLDFAEGRSKERLHRDLKGAAGLLRKTFEEVDKYCFATLRDTEAYIYLLRGEVGLAKEIFLNTAVVRVASRIHLAIIYMMGTQLYERSECYLRRALSQLAGRTWSRNYRLAQHLLQLIEDSRRDGVVFNEELAFYHDRTLKQIPSSARTYAEGKQRVGVLTQLRPVTFVANELSMEYLPRMPKKGERFCTLSF